jgi:hypothetical protein
VFIYVEPSAGWAQSSPMMQTAALVQQPCSTPPDLHILTINRKRAIL